MDYLNMILTGYLKDKDYLNQYFIREQKKAQQKGFIEADEFFGKSEKIIQSLYQILDDQLNKRKHELYFMLDRAKNKTSNFPDSNHNSNLSYDDQCQERIEYCQSELKEISRNNYSVTLHIITKGKFVGHLWNRDIMFIESILKKAEQKVLRPTAPQNKDVKQKKTLKDYFHNITDFDSFISEIEDSFHMDNGKPLIGVMRILIDEDILVIQDRELKPFYNSWKESTTKIKLPSYEYINRELDKISLDNQFLQPIKTKLVPTIRKYKTKLIPT